ncbi:MAG: hypothetical protein PHH44_01670 [bacterium]|nr:hypothetical protein [bacterium]
MNKYLTVLKVAARTFLIIFLLSCIGQLMVDRTYGKGAPVEYANKFYFFNRAKSLMPISPDLYAKAKIIEELFSFSLLLALILNVLYQYEKRKLRL